MCINMNNCKKNTNVNDKLIYLLFIVIYKEQENKQYILLLFQILM